MPLTAKGREILAAMKKQYGKRGESVFYASKNAGKISGVDASTSDAQHRRWQHLMDRVMKRITPKEVARDYKPTYDALTQAARRHFAGDRKAKAKAFRSSFRDAMGKGLSVRDAMKQALDMCGARK